MLPHLEKGLNAEYEENNLQSVLIVHAEDENTHKNSTQCVLLPHMHFIYWFFYRVSADTESISE